jgi:hypothetical protein
VILLLLSLSFKAAFEVLGVADYLPTYPSLSASHFIGNFPKEQLYPLWESRRQKACLFFCDIFLLV